MNKVITNHNFRGNCQCNKTIHAKTYNVKKKEPPRAYLLFNLFSFTTRAIRRKIAHSMSWRTRYAPKQPHETIKENRKRKDKKGVVCGTSGGVVRII